MGNHPKDIETRMALTNRRGGAIERLRGRSEIKPASGGNRELAPLRQLTTALDRADDAIRAATPETLPQLLMSRFAPTATQKVMAQGEAELVEEVLKVQIDLLRDWHVAGREFVAQHLNQLLDEAAVEHEEDLQIYISERGANLGQELYRIVSEFTRWWNPAWAEVNALADEATRELKRRHLLAEVDQLDATLRQARQAFVDRCAEIRSRGA